MRHLLLFLIGLIASSCNSHCEKHNKALESFSETSILTAEKKTEQPQKTDTLSFDYFLQLSDNIIEEIPQYLIDSFIGTKWNDRNDQYRKIYSDQTKHYKLYDIYLLTFNVSMYGVSGETILASYTYDGKMIDHLSVAESSDMDLSSTSYSFRSFQIFSDSLVQVVDTRKKAKHFEYNMPDSINLFDLDSIDVTETLDYNYYVIQRSGEFLKVLPIQPILDEQTLKNLSKSELRIKRNEFFARHGYIFQSSDLIEHFSNLSWYKPRYKDVTDKLTAFDIYNINLIKRIEDEK